ncbi:MAG: hypothetical protein ACI8ZT_001961 [Bacteroidia bacterium]|jgi:hypothetical protein
MNVKQNGKWRLPGLTFSGDWFALSYAEISRRMFSQYGLTVTVLRRLQRGTNFMICELEVQSYSPDVKFEARWYDLEAHQSSGKAGAQGNEFLDSWFLHAENAKLPGSRPPWESAGWFKQASSWITKELGKQDIYKMGEIGQIKSGVLTSVLSIPCNTGKVFFKASMGDSPSEVAISEELARRWPTKIMQLLASDSNRNWMLMPDYGAQGYAEVPEDRHATAAQSYARLLIESKDSISTWQQLNCPDFGLEQIHQFSQSFSDRTAPFKTGKTTLDDSELDMLVNYVEEWGSMCPSLAEFEIPDTLVNLDFRLSNIVANNDDFLFFDWHESVISHPFFCLLNLFDEFTPLDPNDINFSMLESQQSTAKASIRDAFLEVFGDFESKERLLEAFSLASTIQPVVQLKRWLEKLEKVEPDSFWADELTLNLILWARYYISK